MRFATFAAVAAIAVSGVASTPVDLALPPTFDINFVLGGFDLSAGNFYGSPIAPWKPGSKPGWYYGNNPNLFPDLPYLEGIICRILEFFPFLLQCPVKKPPPPPNDGYTQTFSNLTGATQADDFQTFGLVDTVADCKAMCNSVTGCNFANSYHDVNGKGGSTQLTCSLFTKCHDASTADNKGGQSQPDGSIDFIINSDGWCKNGVKVSDTDATST
ncbi:hypothetical protein GALMADRAFT_269631 [Galerina marginata CBS 339.88]|uniref:Apple domain-containing protein n=1 Tax=Galerina marginata (strain CBS 339.88) TaxID=685588 RepID=A0A067STC4_GALM3|nr:hypothetical protein GALMADRAFT_269631 [Galerina marginata CBS 339.88]